MKKLIALLLAVVLCLGCFVLPAAAGEAEWRLSNAEETESGLRVGKENEEGCAYYVTSKAGSQWTLSADVTASIYNGGVGTVSLALGTGEKDSMGLAGLLNFAIWNSDEFGMYQIWYNGFQEIYNGQWVDCNGAQPVGGDESNKKALTSKTFKLTVVREEGKNCLNVRIQTAEGVDVLNFTTGDMEESVMQSVTYLGLRTWSADAQINNFSLSASASSLQPVEPSWKLINAAETETGLTLGKENEEAYAYYIANKAGSQWTLSADVTASIYNGNAGSFSLALGTGEKDSMGLAGLLNFAIWNSDEYGMYQIWYNGFQEIYNGQWVDCNGAQPVGGDESNKKALTSKTFKLTVVREEGKNCLNVRIQTAEGVDVLNFTTGDMEESVMQSVTYLGLRTWSADAQISSFSLKDEATDLTPPAPPTPPTPGESEWQLVYAVETEDGLLVGEDHENACAYYVGQKTGSQWTISADVTASIYNGNAGVFSLALATGEKDSMGLAGLLNFNIWNSDEYGMYQIWYNGFQEIYNGQWVDCNGSQPVGGDESNKMPLTSKTFKVTIVREEGKNCLNVLIQDAQGKSVLHFTTGSMDESVMQSVTYLGLRTWSAEAQITNFSFKNEATDITPPTPVESNWKLINAVEAGSGVNLGGKNEEAYAYYIAGKVGAQWTLTADVTADIFDGEPGGFSVALAAGDKDNPALAALLNFNVWSSDQYGMYQIWYNGFQEILNGQWVDCNGSQPVGGEESNKKPLTSRTFRLTVAREEGKNCLHVLIQDAEGKTVLNFVTGDMDAALLNEVSYLGVRTWSSKAEVRSFKLSDSGEGVPYPVRKTWKVDNATASGSSVSLGGKNAESMAYYVGRQLGGAWVMSADVNADIYNGEPGRFSVMLGSGDAENVNLVALLNLNTWNSEQHNMYQVWYAGFQQLKNGQWLDRNGSEPANGAEQTKKALTDKTFKLIVEKKQGENFLRVIIKDAKGNTVSSFMTGELDADVMNSVSYVGLRTYSAKAEVTNFSVGTDYPATGDGMQFAWLALAMLMSAAALLAVLALKKRAARQF